MNRALLTPATPAEIKEATFSIGSTQSPGSDGFTGLFFQRYWDVVGTAVIDAVQDFFTKGKLLRTLNHTWIALIPKVSNANSMRQLRPIGLCTVPYKIISKILSSRLGDILPQIIHPSQNGFIKHRSITDNILLAHELIHFLKTHSGDQHLMALKIDMEKAYDRVEWPFLFAVMRGLGFADSWIALIRECLSSASMDILFNGNPKGFFTPTRGLRQGDPLSPLLFAICSEGLSRLLLAATTSGVLYGIRINRRCPFISHLMFADDTILFLRVTDSYISALLSLFNQYRGISGQRVNLAKSAVLFSNNTPPHIQLRYRDALGVRFLERSEKYLGLPCIILRSKEETFRFIEDKMSLRLRSWKRECLSPAGVHTLLQSVISGLPVYAMSCFELTNKMCEALNDQMAKFWWGKVTDDRRLHWLSWARLSLPKEAGGLGFRDFATFNRALLAKQCWRILTNPDLLLSRVLKSVYFPNTTLLQSNGRGRPSWGWQSLLLGRDFLSPGLRWQIGSGMQVDVLQDCWLPGPRPLRPSLRGPGVYLGPPTVAGLISQGRWNVPLLRYWFSEETVRTIQTIPLPWRPQVDRRVWHHSSSGVYTVSSGYDFGMQSRPDLFSTNLSPMESSTWNSIWSLRMQPKLCFFLWKILHRILPTLHGIMIRVRSETIDPLCQVCYEAPESVEHLLLHCVITRRFLHMCSLTPPDLGDTHISIYWKTILLTQSHLKEVWVLAWWRLWKGRNRVVFDKAQVRLEKLFQYFHIQWREHSLIYAPLPSPSPPSTSSSLVSWLPPRPTRLKINVDGAVRPGMGGASGWVLRNSAGVVLRAIGATYPGIVDPFVLELLAFRDACTWCFWAGVL
ncbi:LINE-1 retrotransposable element ORF2 protein [Linum perenne]